MVRQACSPLSKEIPGISPRVLDASQAHQSHCPTTELNVRNSGLIMCFWKIMPGGASELAPAGLPRAKQAMEMLSRLQSNAMFLPH